jgi:hypothetical protein
MASIAIMIATPQGRRLLATSTEREAALATESVLRRLPATALPAAVWVQCADPDITRRLTAYLGEMQAEMVEM